MQIINVTNCGDVHDNFDRFISGEAKGKVQLAVPVANILQWKPVEGELYLLTNILPEELEKVIKYAGYVVLDPKNTGIKKNTVITEEEYAELMELSQKELIDSGILAKSYAVLAASVLVTHVACALLFNYLYLRHCTQTIERINRSADILGEMSRADFRLNLLARGGVSVFGILLGYFAKTAIEQIVAFIMSFFAG